MMTTDTFDITFHRYMDEYNLSSAYYAIYSKFRRNDNQEKILDIQPANITFVGDVRLDTTPNLKIPLDVKIQSVTANEIIFEEKCVIYVGTERLTDVKSIFSCQPTMITYIHNGIKQRGEIGIIVDMSDLANDPQPSFFGKIKKFFGKII